MASVHKCTIAFAVSALCLHLVATQSFNPTILQDSRDLPHTDGTFGFLYRTEDGIAHAAKGDSDGQVHGRFSYTDPTGLKVNYNYNAGSRVTPGYNYNDAPVPRQYESPAPQPPPQQYQEPQQSYQPQYVPRTRPQPQQQRPQPKYHAKYRADEPLTHFRAPVEAPADVYQLRRTRPQTRRNEVFDDY